MWELMVNHANAADLVLTPSEHFREKLLHYGVKKAIKVFPSGYPDARFPKNPTAKSLKPGEELKIIWHSRVSGEKRIMPFLKALESLDAKYVMNVYGGGGDLKKAKHFVEKHGLNVKFHGSVPFDELADSIGEAHLDVLASYNFDTFGMTLIEAEAYGVPVFICDPDLKEVVPEDSYVISRNENPEEMAEALKELLDAPERINQMSKVMLKNRKDVLISHRIKILEKILKEIIKK
jgi:glycosyltransferase involved in cell wall biosynthesis